MPFCKRRCGYCDFNTYVPASPALRQLADSYRQLAIQEMDWAYQALASQAAAEQRLDNLALAQQVACLENRPLETVFFGGGTPTFLPDADLVALLQAAKSLWGLQPGAEVTCEANPDTVGLAYLETLAKAGFNRVSFGAQSFSPEVLASLERTHRPEQLGLAVAWAKQVGLAVSLDLIYGTPGESLASWEQTLDATIELEPDHVSCYALTIEPGTPLARQLAGGLIADTSQDDLASKYELADLRLSQAGYDWYEISNWAKPGCLCRHNLAYWHGGQWWGIGPGAHSSLGRWRFWNQTHPADWAGALEAGRLPLAGQELVQGQAAELERIMLGLRLASGLPLAGLKVPVDSLVAEGLVNQLGERIVLTVRGRLLADLVTRRLAF